jgi:hypothetical protein
VSIFTTATDIARLQADVAAAKTDLGKTSYESESARHLLLMERLVNVMESLDARSRESEHQLKRLQPDGK